MRPLQIITAARLRDSERTIRRGICPLPRRFLPTVAFARVLKTLGGNYPPPVSIADKGSYTVMGVAHNTHAPFIAGSVFAHRAPHGSRKGVTLGDTVMLDRSKALSDER